MLGNSEIILRHIRNSDKINGYSGNAKSLKENCFQFLKDICNNSNKEYFHFEENRKAIEKFFSKLIPDYNKDLLIITCKLGRIVKDEFFPQIELKETFGNINRTKQKNLDTLRDIINRCENHLIIDGENLILITKILSDGFNDIIEDYKLKTFSEFVMRMNSENKQIEKEYKDMIDKSNKEKIKFHEVDILNDNFLLNRLNQTLLNYNILQNFLTTKNNLPNELRELSEILKSITSISFHFRYYELVLDKVSLPISVYLLFLINCSWMFKNLNEVKISYDYNKLEDSDYFPDEILKRIEKGDKILKSTFIKLITISRFVSKMENISTLKIDLPYSYQSEIETVLKLEKISVKNFHLLDSFAELKNLKNFEITFNTLDSNTYKRIMLIINNNSEKLKSLKIRLFPKYYNNNILLSKRNLYQLCFVNKIDTKEIKEKYTKKTFLSIEYDNLLMKEKDYMINHLVNLFEMDIEILFFLLSIILTNLNTLYLSCELPQEIQSNDKFTNILHKFLFNNLLTYISTSLESLQNLSIVSNVTMNVRTHQNLKKYLDNFDLIQNKTLKKLRIDLKFKKFDESIISKFIPRGIEFLSIGQLDFVTFQYFSDFISNRDNNIFLLNLTNLNITLSDVIFNFNKNIDDLIKLIKASKPKNVEYINFNLKIPLTKDNAARIVQNVPDDHVKVYRIYFINCENSKCLFDDISNKQIKSWKAYNNLIFMLLFMFYSRSNRKSLSNLKGIITNTTKYLNINREKKLIIKFDE